jgi:putative transcriptional regulator
MKRKVFEELVDSIKEAGQIRRGNVPASRETRFRAEDIKKIRAKLEKSQSEFARMIGVSTATLQNWEQGRREPEGPARALLRVAASSPRVVQKALSARNRRA